MIVVARESVRGDDGWRIAMARTGAWDEPPPSWALPQHQASSPFTPQEASGALEALREIYPHPKVQEIFRRDSGSLWQLFVDPWAASHSRLVALGLDAMTCGASKSKSLVDALNSDRRSFEGACFEIAVYAAMERTGISCVHEPLRRLVWKPLAACKNQRNPDFAIDAGIGSPVFLEVKLARDSDRTEEERDWLLKFGMRRGPSASIAAGIEMLHPYTELQERDRGAWMRANIERLVAAVSEVAVWLSTSAIFPAVAVVEDCIRVEVQGPPSSIASGGTLGVVLNSEREAERIVRNLIAEGVTQLPESHVGLVLVDPGPGIDTEAIRTEIERWFAAEGADYKHLLGVLIVSREYADDFAYTIRRVTPHWRATAPRALRESPVWDALTVGLSWHDLRRAGVWDRLIVDAQ